MIALLRELPFFIKDIKEHDSLKGEIISAIEGMGAFSYINNDQKISSTDWHLVSNYPRPYYALVKPILQGICMDISKKMGYEEELTVRNYWYQKYNQGDSHKWHMHLGANFSSVYYLNLPEGSSKTTFKILDKEFSIDVKEGQILSFPGIATHCSKPNESKEPKIVIAFNC
jgi:hypothetical protein